MASTTNIFHNITNSQGHEGVNTYQGTSRIKGDDIVAAIRKTDINPSEPSAGYNICALGTDFANYLSSVGFFIRRGYCTLLQPETNACIIRYRHKSDSYNAEGSGDITYETLNGGNYYAYRIVLKDNVPVYANNCAQIEKHLYISKKGKITENAERTIYGTARTLVNSPVSDYVETVNLTEYLSTNDKNAFIRLIEAGSYYFATSGNSSNNGFYLVDQAMSGNNFVAISGLPASTILTAPSWLPVFDVTDTSGIKNWLDNGVLEGELAPEEYGEGVEAEERAYTLDDYATYWQMWFSKGDGNGNVTIKWSTNSATGLTDEQKNRIKVALDAPFLGFDHPYRTAVYTEKIMSLMLSDIAKTSDGSSWINSNGDLQGFHTFGTMLYTSAGYSNVPLVGFTFDNSSDIGISFDPTKFSFTHKNGDTWGSVSHTYQKTSDDTYVFTSTDGDVVVVYLHDYAGDENDEYDTDDGQPYSGTYGGGNYTFPSGTSSYRIYELTKQELENVFTGMTSFSWSTILSGIFGVSAWSCFKSLVYMPYSDATSTPVTSVKIGTLEVNTSAKLSSPVFGRIFSSTKFTIPRVYNNFLDYSPYTNVFLHLPYVGYISLPTNEVYGCNLHVAWILEDTSGECIWQIFRDGCLRWTYRAQCGANIPLNALTKEGFVRLGASLIQNSIPVSSVNMASLASAMAIPKDLHNDGIDNGWLAQCDSMSVFYIIDSPVAQLASTAPHTFGRPCELSKVLSSLRGFTKCSNIDVSGFNCTDSERDELISLLESGVYL